MDLKNWDLDFLTSAEIELPVTDNQIKAVETWRKQPDEKAPNDI